MQRCKMSWSNDWSNASAWPIGSNTNVASKPWEHAPVFEAGVPMQFGIDWADPRDAKSQEVILKEWQELKDKLTKIKEAEMEMRVYVVKRAFPQAHSGTNRQTLDDGSELKAGVSFNYKLTTDIEAIEKALDLISAMGNKGPYYADELIKWKAEFREPKYKELIDNPGESEDKIKKEFDKLLTVTDAAPTLEIKPPKKDKKK